MTAPDVQAAMDKLDWMHYQATKSFPHIAGDCELCDAQEVIADTLDRFAARVDTLEQELARLYDDVDKAQRFDNTGGDSAVAVVLWSWAERRAALSAADNQEQR